MTSCIVTDSDRCVGIVFRICLTGEKNTNSSQVANFGGAVVQAIKKAVTKHVHGGMHLNPQQKTNDLNVTLHHNNGSYMSQT